MLTRGSCIQMYDILLFFLIDICKINFKNQTFNYMELSVDLLCNILIRYIEDLVQHDKIQKCSRCIKTFAKYCNLRANLLTDSPLSKHLLNLLLTHSPPKPGQDPHRWIYLDGTLGGLQTRKFMPHSPCAQAEVETINWTLLLTQGGSHCVCVLLKTLSYKNELCVHAGENSSCIKTCWLFRFWTPKDEFQSVWLHFWRVKHLCGK